MPTADELLGPAAVRALITTVERASGRKLAAVRKVVLADLGLSDRARALAVALLADLPGTSSDLHATLRQALGDSRFTGWLIWPASEAVAIRAVDADGEFEDGLALLAEMTPRLTGEFAIRTFLNADLDRTLTVVRRWTDHPDEHVRRLATEGTRARLPWAKRVPLLFAEPGATVPILDALYRDESEYVRRSVANHLNDISRLDPELAEATAARWLRAAAPTTARLVRQAMRTLIKQGHPGALLLMGFPPAAGLSITDLVVDRLSITIGEDLTLSFTIEHQGTEPARLAIDYAVHYVKANGSTAPKVFKLSVKQLAPGERVAVSQEAFVPAHQHAGSSPRRPPHRSADQRATVRRRSVRTATGRPVGRSHRSSSGIRVPKAGRSGSNCVGGTWGRRRTRPAGPSAEPFG